jgi:hypothetical protein
MRTNQGNEANVTSDRKLDFISGYADYADVLEAPRILHELVGIQLVATALNRNGVTFQNGPIPYSLDLWMALLSGSGAGRSTTVGLAAPILKGADLEGLEGSVRWGSAAVFYQHFSENPCGLFVWGEMAERLKMLNEPRFATVKEWLTDRYDNFKTPPPHIYRATGKKSDTPTIEFERAPRINILATSASDWFFRNLVEEDSAGGFLPRWLLVRADGEGRDVAIPRTPDASLIEPLAQQLKQIGRLKGEAGLSLILPLYEKWYSNAKRRFESQPNRALASAYFNRHRGHVLKLAVIFEASQNARLKVGVSAWVRASQFARKIEESTFAMLPTGMSAVGYEQQRIEERIRQAGPDGLSRNDLTRCFQSMNAMDREQQIKTLVAAGRIFSDVRQTSGRPGTVYVHEDFRQEAQ